MMDLHDDDAAHENMVTVDKAGSDINSHSSYMQDKSLINNILNFLAEYVTATEGREPGLQ